MNANTEYPCETLYVNAFYDVSLCQFDVLYVCNVNVVKRNRFKVCFTFLFIFEMFTYSSFWSIIGVLLLL